MLASCCFHPCINVCQVAEILVEYLDQHAEFWCISIVIIRAQPVDFLDRFVVTIFRYRLQKHAFPDTFIGIITVWSEAIVNGIKRTPGVIVWEECQENGRS